MYQMQMEEMMPLHQIRSQEHHQHQLSATQALHEEHKLYNTRVWLCIPARLTHSLHMLCEQSLKTLTSQAPDLTAPCIKIPLPDIPAC